MAASLIEKTHSFAAVPFNALGDRTSGSGECGITRFDAASRGEPSKSRRPKERAARYHFSPRFHERRNSKFQTQSYRSAIPRRYRTELVLFPAAQPRKLFAHPYVSKSEIGFWRPRDKVAVLLRWLDPMCGKAAGRRGRGERSQI